MRALDLAIFVIMIEMCIGFLANPTLGLFTETGQGYLGADAASNVYVEEYQSTQNLNSLIKKPEDVNLLTFGMDWLFAGWTMLISIFSAFVLISWTLYTTFHIPIEICVFLQGIIYLIYAWGIIQWRSGRGGQYFE